MTLARRHDSAGPFVIIGENLPENMTDESLQPASGGGRDAWALPRALARAAPA